MEFLTDRQAESLQGGWFSINVAPRLTTSVTPQINPQVSTSVAPVIRTDVATVVTSQLNLAVPTAVAVFGARAESNVASMFNVVSVGISS